MQVSGEGAHLSIVFEGAGQQVSVLMAQEGASKIKRLGSEQGYRSSCFEHPGGQLVEMITLEKIGPARPFILRMHRFSIA